MISKFIRRHLTGTINWVEVFKEDTFTKENSACAIITNKTFDEKVLLNSSWFPTVPSITFILYK